MRKIVFRLAPVLLVSGFLFHSLPTLAEEGGSSPRALLMARNETILAAQIAAKIENIGVNEGERFKKGQILASFDCALQTAQLQKAKAEQDNAEGVLETQIKLGQLKSGSELELKLAQGSLAKAKSEHTYMNVLVDMCKIKAPFDGRVISKKASSHQNVSQGQAVLEIIDDSVLEAHIIVPSRWLTWLRLGLMFDIYIDETRRNYRAEITTIGAKVDPASQSIKIIGEIKGKFPELLAGMSGPSSLKGP